MHALELVTNSRSRFFNQQIRHLEAGGVRTTTLAVPGDRDYGGGGVDGRSPVDYLRFYPTVLRHSFRDYDLVHANYGLTGPAAVAQPSLPVVLSLWGTDLMGPFGPVSAACARLADAVVVMSPEMASRLDGECHVIPHGVDLDRFAPAPPAEARAELGWNPSASHVLFPYPAGREVKNYPRAERVVDLARERVDGDVEFHTVSGVSHERMPVYMNAADALLLTSRREGSPNSVKEAMACNLPVVSVDVGDVRARLDGVSPSYVRDSDDGLATALADVLADGERSNGREAAREVSVQRTNERLREVYRDVVADA
ncbi:glycosyltransferase [Halorarum salinum]|uniref:Glycosyltransferase n=1 Tax=Halorarum salinum TaxID=2743089 RepID=A0A7D5LDC6_9EURY|nr:glycosyltransferase [Halobaculum salinum]QLG64326.1 glycosyltransferase [Halobaculum salinum]